MSEANAKPRLNQQVTDSSPIYGLSARARSLASRAVEANRHACGELAAPTPDTRVSGSPGGAQRASAISGIFAGCLATDARVTSKKLQQSLLSCPPPGVH
jgi:hypothetical protein